MLERRAAASPRQVVVALGLGLAACQKIDESTIWGDDEPTAPQQTHGNDDGPGPGDPTEDGDEASPHPQIYDCDPGNPAPCSPDERCTALIQGDGSVRYTCVVDSPSLDPFDGCIVQEDGRDGCPSGFVCLGKEEHADARCVPLCAQSGECDEGECVAHEITQVRMCESYCNPLVPECPRGLACKQIEDRFGCGITTGRDVGELKFPCFDDMGTRCREGLMCLPSDRLVGCESKHCCTSLCRLDEPQSCTSPEICGPFSGSPGPELEGIGACFSPA